MLFISALEQKESDSGPGELMTCSDCGLEKYQVIREEHQLVSLFFIPLFRFQKRLFSDCPACRKRQEITKSERSYVLGLVALNKMYLNELIDDKEYLLRKETLKKPQPKG